MEATRNNLVASPRSRKLAFSSDSYSSFDSRSDQFEFQTNPTNPLSNSSSTSSGEAIDAFDAFPIFMGGKSIDWKTDEGGEGGGLLPPPPGHRENRRISVDRRHGSPAKWVLSHLSPKSNQDFDPFSAALENIRKDGKEQSLAKFQDGEPKASKRWKTIKMLGFEVEIRRSTEVKKEEVKEELVMKTKEEARRRSCRGRKVASREEQRCHALQSYRSASKSLFCCSSAAYVLQNEFK